MRGPGPGRPFFCAAAARSPKLRIGLPALVVLLSFTFLTGCDGLENNGPPTAPSGPLPAGSPVIYAAVGASDVTGIGSSNPCLALFTDCPASTGYAFVAARQLRSIGHAVTVNNLSIPTAVISERVRTLGLDNGHQTFGSLIDQLMPFIPPAATLVTVFAGANDVKVILAALGRGAGGSNPVAFIDEQVRLFGADYESLIEGIQRRAPDARIVVLNLPNMGALPFLAGGTLPERQAAQRASVETTKTGINTLTGKGVRVADLMCDPRFYLASTFSADGFHPNDQGYVMFADHVVKAATAPSYPNPQASCSQMTLIR